MGVAVVLIGVATTSEKRMKRAAVTVVTVGHEERGEGGERQRGEGRDRRERKIFRPGRWIETRFPLGTG